MDIVKIPGYRHMAMEDGTIFGVRGKPLVPIWNKATRYWWVGLRPDGTTCVKDTVPIHVAICRTFHGERPNGLQVRHIDDNRDNNAASNLMWGTALENQEDAKRNGKTPLGSDRPNAKLTKEIVLLARERYGESASHLAYEFGVNRATMWAAIVGISWAWV